MSLGKNEATEHLRDGEDNIRECLKTIKRVLKDFPVLQPTLARASDHLNNARTALVEAHSSLKDSSGNT